MTTTQTVTTTPADAEWVDRSYPLPAIFPAPGVTGSMEITMWIFGAIERWGHDVDDLRYIEETSANRNVAFDAVRALRMECTVDGRPVSVRHSNVEWRPDAVWTVTLEGRTSPVPMTRSYLMHEKIAEVAHAVHRAIMSD